MRRSIAITIMVVLASAPSAHADEQDLCKDILRVSIRDYHENVKWGTLEQSMEKWACNSDFRTVQDGLSAGLSVAVKSLPIAANFTQTSFDDWKRTNCESSRQSIQQQSFASAISSVLSPAAVDAWARCIAERGTGMQADVRASLEYAGERVFKVTIEWKPTQTVLVPPKITSFAAVGATCKFGTVKNALAPGLELRYPVEQLCKRSGRAPVEISINTTLGPIRPSIRLPRVPAPAIIVTIDNEFYAKPNRPSRTVGENETASLQCDPGTRIVAFTSTYGANTKQCGPSWSCGSCAIGSPSCTVTYNNNACGDCAPGPLKNGDLNLVCEAPQQPTCEAICSAADGRCKPDQCGLYMPKCQCATDPAVPSPLDRTTAPPPTTPATSTQR